ncbi:hypothetical protein J3E68DRAFT_108823 [Trichoderma sp. SZMC 28012]
MSLILSRKIAPDLAWPGLLYFGRHACDVHSQATKCRSYQPRLSFRSPASSNDLCNGGASVYRVQDDDFLGSLAPGFDHFLFYYILLFSTDINPGA